MSRVISIQYFTVRELKGLFFVKDIIIKIKLTYAVPMFIQKQYDY